MNHKTFSERLMEPLFLLSAAVSIASVVMICVFLFASGLPAIAEIGPFEFLFGQRWKPVDVPPSFGILSMIVGTLYVTGGAIVLGVQVGILCAIFCACFCPKKLHKVIGPAVGLLAGIPSIIYGFFGMQLVVPFVRTHFGGNGFSILSAAIILGIMILPTIISISESSLRAVDPSYLEAALGLGATYEEAVFRVVLPAAKSGVLTSIILGIGRAAGETMAVVMVAGGAVMPLDKIELLKPIRTLTANIVTEMSYSSGLHTDALIATGVVLFAFIILLNLLLGVLRAKKEG